MIMHMLSAMETAAAKVLRIVKEVKSIDQARAAIRMHMLIVQMEMVIAKMLSGLLAKVVFPLSDS